MKELQEIRQKIEEGKQKKIVDDELAKTRKIEKEAAKAAAKDDVEVELRNTMARQKKMKIAIAAALLIVGIFTIHAGIMSFGGHKKSPDYSANELETEQVIKFSKSIAKELGDNGVNAVLPLLSENLEDETREKYRQGLEQLDAATISFSSVQKHPGNVFMAFGSDKQNNIVFQFTPSPRGLILCSVDVQNKQD